MGPRASPTHGSAKSTRNAPACPCGAAPQGCWWPHGLLTGSLSQPYSFSLQSSKVVQGLTGLRNLGNTVSACPLLWAQPQPTQCHSVGTLGTPASTLPVVQVDKRIPTLPPAPSPSPARPPQGAPLPPPASLPPPHVAMVFCLPQCFMNSILQCLSNTKELRDYCLQNQYLRDLNNNSRMRTALMSGIRGGGEGGQDGDSCGVHPSPPPSPYR